MNENSIFATLYQNTFLLVSVCPLANVFFVHVSVIV